MAVFVPGDFQDRGGSFVDPSTKSTVQRNRYCSNNSFILSGECATAQYKYLQASANINALVGCSPIQVVNISLSVRYISDDFGAGGETYPAETDAAVKTNIDSLWTSYLAGFTCPV